MSIPMRIGAVLFFIGILGGTLTDRTLPQKPAIMRDGLRVLEADFHAHTRFSDGFLSPFDLVLHAQRRGLDVLAITEHNITFPAQMGRWFSKQISGPTILIGEEVTTNRFHLHGIGLTHRIDASQSLSKVIDDVHAQGGLVIAAHPVKKFWSAFLKEREKIDAAEIMHPLAFGMGGGREWRWQEMKEFYDTSWKEGKKLTAIGSSDFHFFSVLGVCRTLVFAKDASAQSVLQALKEGRTVVYDREGRAYGHPEHVASLAQHPYPFEKQDYAYKGQHAPDRITRLAGLIGLFLLFVSKTSKKGLPDAGLER